MLSADSTRKLDRGPAPASWAKTFILVLFIVCVAALVGTRSAAMLQGSDFPHFYCAARMLADGHGHQLFDPDLQRQYQARYAGRIGTLYTHTPFEAVLYLAVAWLPLRYAYALWTLLSMTFLAMGMRLLAREGVPSWNWRLLFVALLTFVPALIGLLQGQDSALLLLLIILAFTALRRERSFAAGCWLALGLFKFQLIVPLTVVLALTQRKKFKLSFVKGFGITALALAGVSIAISGWSVLTLYPRFLLHFKEQPFGGLVPQAMANFRGLIYLFLHSDRGFWSVAALAILCAGALVKNLIDWKRARLVSAASPVQNHDAFDLAFANTVMFALLVSYHLNPQDLTLLLLPIVLLLRHTLARPWQQWRPANWITLLLLAVLALPPAHLWALKSGVYSPLALPLLALFLFQPKWSVTAPATIPETAIASRD